MTTKLSIINDRDTQKEFWMGTCDQCQWLAYIERTEEDRATYIRSNAHIHEWSYSELHWSAANHNKKHEVNVREITLPKKRWWHVRSWF